VLFAFFLPQRLYFWHCILMARNWLHCARLGCCGSSSQAKLDWWRCIQPLMGDGALRGYVLLKKSIFQVLSCDLSSRSLLNCSPLLLVNRLCLCSNTLPSQANQHIHYRSGFRPWRRLRSTWSFWSEGAAVLKHGVETLQNNPWCCTGFPYS
jgi:hypothetical protein